MQIIDPEAITIERLGRGDEARVLEVFDAMSPESRYFRFLQATPVLTNGMRRILADVDGVRHRAWVASTGGRTLGIVRLVADQTGDLELSVAVIDAVHRQGIGRRLVETALQAAAESGTANVTVLIHPQNSSSVAMFRGMGAEFKLEYGLFAGRVPTRMMAVAA
ncbi:MAG: GNAT family N-acetyltransferase [Acidimicrobiia bacterium]|nr:GNAT family N-acetyltransferase [Acidimicrobiia bacterium]